MNSVFGAPEELASPSTGFTAGSGLSCRFNNPEWFVGRERGEVGDHGRLAIRHLVIVRRDQTAVYDYLFERLGRDPKSVVIVDRRREERRRHAESRQPERRVAARRRPPTFWTDLRFRFVIVTREREPCVTAEDQVGTGAQHWKGEAMSNGEMGAGGDRQRVDRWIEESQYVIGRLIPGLLDDRDRLRNKAEVAEQETERLRQEIGELRREIGELHSEKQYVKSEQAAIAEAFHRAMDHLSQMHQPLNEVLQRLPMTPSAPLNM